MPVPSFPSVLPRLVLLHLVDNLSELKRRRHGGRVALVCRAWQSTEKTICSLPNSLKTQNGSKASRASALLATKTFFSVSMRSWKGSPKLSSLYMLCRPARVSRNFPSSPLCLSTSSLSQHTADSLAQSKSPARPSSTWMACTLSTFNTSPPNFPPPLL
jgi:hypothetical protein